MNQWIDQSLWCCHATLNSTLCVLSWHRYCRSNVASWKMPWTNDFSSYKFPVRSRMFAMVWMIFAPGLPPQSGMLRLILVSFFGPVFSVCSSQTWVSGDSHVTSARDECRTRLRHSILACLHMSKHIAVASIWWQMELLIPWEVLLLGSIWMHRDKHWTAATWKNPEGKALSILGAGQTVSSELDE